MKRLLLVTTSYPEHAEGESAAGVFVRDFAFALTDNGVTLDVVAPGKTGGQRIEAGISVTRFPVPRLPLSLLSLTRPGDWRAIAATLTRGARAVAEICQRQRPDHILALWALPSGDWAMRSGKRFGIPYSTWALGSDVWGLGRIPGLRQYLGYVMRNAARRFADGFQLSQDVESISGEPCRFLASSRNFGAAGVRAINTHPPYRLAFLGRWHLNKGVDLLLDALELLRSDDWSRIDAVRIFGGGPLEGQVHGSVAELRSAGRPVEVGGYRDLEEARALFDWADYVLIPSRIESIPVVFSDAMQACRPLVCTPVGDLPQLMAKYRVGIAAASTTPAAIAAAIRAALHSDASAHLDGLTRAANDFDIRLTAGGLVRLIFENSEGGSNG